MFTKDLQSNVIAFLRFPLIVGVVFIHNTSTTIIMPDMEFGNVENLPIFDMCSTLFSQILGRVAVPLFFFISGFLFFRNIDGFTKQDYLKKLKGRGKTLLIPYLFWNITAIFIPIIARNIPALAAWFSTTVEYNLQYLLKSVESMWGTMNDEKTMTYPIAYQFWFIRDLMVVVILTPVIHFCIKKTKIYGVLLLGVLWFFGWWFSVAGMHGLSITAIFFFTAGAYFGSNKLNIIDIMGKVQRLSYVLYPLLVIADLLTKNYDVNSFIHKTGIIVGMVFWVNVVASLLRTGKIRVNRFLVSSPFFLFAIHDPILLSKIRKVLYVTFNPQSDLVITMIYFLLVIIVVFIALGLYYILKRFMPRFTAIITGGR
jgi:surface polysaccharide O-acyltransferase-like enzyme